MSLKRLLQASVTTESRKYPRVESTILQGIDYSLARESPQTNNRPAKPTTTNSIYGRRQACISPLTEFVQAFHSRYTTYPDYNTLVINPPGQQQVLCNCKQSTLDILITPRQHVIPCSLVSQARHEQIIVHQEHDEVVLSCVSAEDEVTYKKHTCNGNVEAAVENPFNYKFLLDKVYNVLMSYKYLVVVNSGSITHSFHINMVLHSFHYTLIVEAAPKDMPQ